MKLFVGRRFHDRGKPSILLVGESHYLPKESSVHMSATNWYAGSSSALSVLENSFDQYDGACPPRVRATFQEQGLFHLARVVQGNERSRASVQRICKRC